jgi:hypothetical protein
VPDQNVVVKNTATEPVPVEVVNDLRAQNALQKCLEQDLDPGFEVPFSSNIPDGKRLIIEFITAQVLVPAGESAQLRLVTYSGTDVYKFDLSLISQGQVGGQAEVLVATHAIRAYSDKRPSASEDFQVNVNRDNDVTPGHALICLSGYLVDLAA